MLFVKHFTECFIVNALGVVILNDCKNNLPEDAFEFGFFYDLPEKFCHLLGRIIECSATEGAKNKATLPVIISYAQDSSNLTHCTIELAYGNLICFSIQMISGYGHKVYMPRGVDKPIAFGLSITKYSDSM